jgi:hypothetical protein
MRGSAQGFLTPPEGSWYQGRMPLVLPSLPPPQEEVYQAQCLLVHVDQRKERMVVTSACFLVSC